MLARAIRAVRAWLAPWITLQRWWVAWSKAVGAGNCVTLCDLGVFMDQAAEPVPAQNTPAPSLPWADAPSGGWVLLQRPVRPMDVVVVGVLAEDQPQVPSAG